MLLPEEDEAGAVGALDGEVETKAAAGIGGGGEALDGADAAGALAGAIGVGAEVAAGAAGDNGTEAAVTAPVRVVWVVALAGGADEVFGGG